MPGRSEALELVREDFLSDTGLVTCASIFQLKPSDILGKTVLDLGSGRSNRISNELRLFDTSHAYGLNPLLGLPDEIERREIPIEPNRTAIAGLAQQLPFREASFDVVVSLMAIPKCLRAIDVPVAINEIWRILKPGGHAYMWPWSYHQPKTSFSVDGRFINFGEVTEQSLNGIHESFQSYKKTLLITKPADIGNHPATIIARAKA